MADNHVEDESDQLRLGELITLKQAAKLSGLSYSHIRYLVRTGKIEARKLGRDWFTTEQAVNEYLAQDRRPGPKPQKGSGRKPKKD